jgi:hypothetical protein
MADDRRHYDEGRRHERDWSENEARSWFGDDKSRQRLHPTMHSPHRGDPGRGNDERDDRYPYGGQREDAHSPRVGGPGPRDEREYGGYYATGSYRTDDRAYHDRYQRDHERYPGPRYGHDDAAEEYYRAAREQRDDFRRYEAQSPGAEFEHDGREREHRDGRSWTPRERGGYWRQYEQRALYAGRGPKDYQRSDDRIREEVCDCMTDDPLLDASEIVVQVSTGVVTLSGTVSSRDQKRRAEDVAERVSGVKDVTNQLRVSREANGHSHTASHPVSQAYGTETPSKSTSGTSA